MTSIFVSYARESETAVQGLAADVKQLDHMVWVDHDLKGGKEWWDQILSHIRDCQVFMMTLSPESLASPACKREYTYAADLGKPILPILIAEGVSLQTLPLKLSQIQYVDYRKRDVGAALKLANALQAVPLAPALPDPLPEPPAVPVSYLGNIAEQIDAGTALGPKDQSALVSDLRRCLRDAETEADARALLKRLRKRNDLYANIRDEIDELLQSPAREIPSELPPPSRAPITVQPEAPRLQAPTFVAPPAPADRPAKNQKRVGSALVGAVIGTVVGGVMVGTSGRGMEITAIPAVLGAVTGGIVGTTKHLILLAVAGAALVSLVVVNMYSGNESAILATAAAFAPGGALVGAIVGLVVEKVLDWRGAA